MLVPPGGGQLVEADHEGKAAKEGRAHTREGVRRSVGHHGCWIAWLRRAVNQTHKTGLRLKSTLYRLRDRAMAEVGGGDLEQGQGRGQEREDDPDQRSHCPPGRAGTARTLHKGSLGIPS